MGSKRIVTAVILPLICVSFLSSQSLVEAAKKEKERRDKIKKKSTKVVTNADLKRGRKSASVIAPSDQKADAAKIKPELKISPQKKSKRPPQKKDNVKPEPADIEQLELKHEKIKERVERLLQKMSDLWQKYNNPADMTPKDRVQSEISQTYLILQKAQQEAAEIRKEWDAAKAKEDNEGSALSGG